MLDELRHQTGGIMAELLERSRRRGNRGITEGDE